MESIYYCDSRQVTLLNILTGLNVSSPTSLWQAWQTKWFFKASRAEVASILPVALLAIKTWKLVKA